jgi:Ca2+-binding EF-hand superfamily protein
MKGDRAMARLNILKSTTLTSILALGLIAGAANAQMNNDGSYSNNGSMNNNSSYSDNSMMNDNNSSYQNNGMNNQNRNASMNNQIQMSGNNDTFSMFDRDDDGQLNEQEFATYTFYTIDTNNDSRISDEEWDQYTSIWYEPETVSYDGPNDFSDYDTNNDGMIEASEYGRAYDSDLYSAWDMDNDGFIETAEYGQWVNVYNDYDSNEVYVW